MFHDPSFSTTFRRALRSLLLLLLSFGCGRFGDVTGTATWNGKPITSGSVIILAADSLTYSGELDENGVYRIPNVAGGNAKVSITSPNPAAMASKFALQAKSASKDPKSRFKAALPPVAPKTWFPIPAQYSSFETSELRLTVISGLNTFNIPLVSAEAKK